MNRIDMVNEGVRLMLRHRDTASAVEAILDMAEPLIRADERERLPKIEPVQVAAIRAQIAADIEAHYTPLNGDVGPSDYDEGLHVAALLARGQCGYVDCMACARIARGES